MRRSTTAIRWAPIALTKARCARVALRNLACAGIFGWSTFVLPVRGGSPLQWTSGTLTVVHFLAASMSLVAIARPRISGLREAGILMVGISSVATVHILYALASSAQQLVQNYGQLGWGLSGVLALIGLLALGLTLPSALYWLRLNAAAPR